MKPKKNLNINITIETPNRHKKRMNSYINSFLQKRKEAADYAIGLDNSKAKNYKITFFNKTKDITNSKNRLQKFFKESRNIGNNFFGETYSGCNSLSIEKCKNNKYTFSQYIPNDNRMNDKESEEDKELMDILFSNEKKSKIFKITKNTPINLSANKIIKNKILTEHSNNQVNNPIHFKNDNLNTINYGKKSLSIFDQNFLLNKNEQNNDNNQFRVGVENHRFYDSSGINDYIYNYQS